MYAIGLNTMLLRLERSLGNGGYILERNRIKTPKLHIEIGGAPLIPALSTAQNRDATIVIVDPIAMRLTNVLVDALELGQFDQIPNILRGIQEYDEIPESTEDLIIETYKYYWGSIRDTKQVRKKLLLVPERMENFSIKGDLADSVSFAFPNPYIVSPESIVENGLRILKLGGILQVMTENTDYKLELDETLNQTQGVRYTSQLVQRFPNSLPVSLYDIIRPEPFRYLVEIQKLS